MPDIVVIGAGAGGLALGYHLRRAGCDFRVLERGAPGESWRRMPEDTRLLSPWWTNVLPGPPRAAHATRARVPSAAYAQYLQQYAAHHAIPLQTSCEVRTIRGNAGAFTLATSAGELRARAVVCATGYYQNPYVPPLAGDDGSVATMHAADYGGPRALRAARPGCRRILVVGRRITAGQIMVELHDAGFEVALSARGAVRLRAKWRKAAWKEELYFAYERLFVTLFRGIKAKEKPIMDGGRTEDLLRSGAIAQVDGVRSIHEGQVELLDGSRRPCDLVVFATGYRPALGFLQGLVPLDGAGLPRLDGMQSADVPGLYFLGLENQRNFLSQYLRGLCADAPVLARQLDRALRD